MEVANTRFLLLCVILLSLRSSLLADDDLATSKRPSDSPVVKATESFPTPLPTKETRTVRSVLDWAHENGMPGAILLIKTPKTTLLDSVGWADVDRKIPMRTDHAFRIGSATKSFLGILAAQLQTEGKLDTDATLTKYLPASITDHIANSDQITVRQLVRHQSGIFNYTDNLLCLTSRMITDRHGEWPAQRFLEYIYDKPANFEPGKGWAYSNSNFLLLGMIIDQVTGEHHSVALRKHILDPLKLEHTYYELREPAIGEMAHGYETIFGGSGDTSDWTADTTGAAGLVSTVSDLAVFVRAVVNSKSGFLDDATRKLMRSQPRRGNDDDPLWPVLGYDFGITAHRGAPRSVPTSVAPWFFGHDGATPGYFCMAFHEPKNDVTVVFFGSSQLLHDLKGSQLSAFEDRLEEAMFALAIQTAKSE
jgi:D-alanyl-D-alanine carboxypeptidase